MAIEDYGFKKQGNLYVRPDGTTLLPDEAALLAQYQKDGRVGDAMALIDEAATRKETQDRRQSDATVANAEAEAARLTAEANAATPNGMPAPGTPAAAAMDPRQQGAAAFGNAFNSGAATATATTDTWGQPNTYESNAVVYGLDGSRQSIPTKVGDRYQPGMEYTYWENLKAQPGAIDDFKKKMYWAGAYGNKNVELGGDRLTWDDVDALREMMKKSNLNGSIDVTDLVNQQFEQGFAKGVPYGLEATDENGDGVPDGSPIGELQAFASKNGLSFSDSFYQTRIQAIKNGEMSIDDVKRNLREKYVAPAFPAWKDEILAGNDIDDLASPYKESMARILDMPSTAISVADPTLRKALQGVGQDGKPTYKPLWQFEQDLRKDDRYQYTRQAHEDYASATMKILRDFGLQG